MPEFSLAEAAGVLGVSTDTVQRRLRKGDLEGHKDTAGRWRVLLPNESLGDHAPHRAADAPQALADTNRLQLELEHTRALVDELRSRVEEQARRMEGYEERAHQDSEERAELRRLLGNAQMQLQAYLPAPRDEYSGRQPPEHEQPEPVPVKEQEPTVLPRDEGQKRPWWKLWG
jgi:excisionase family DNA binding protein